MHCLYTSYSSNNPCGIIINPGWYALAGAILGMSVDKALHKICGFPIGGNRKVHRTHGAKAVLDKQKMRSAMNRKAYSYRILGEVIGYSAFKIYDATRGKPQTLEFISLLEKALDVKQGELLKGE